MALEILLCLQLGVLPGPAGTIKEERGHSVHACFSLRWEGLRGY